MTCALLRDPGYHSFLLGVHHTRRNRVRWRPTTLQLHGSTVSCARKKYMYPHHFDCDGVILIQGRLTDFKLMVDAQCQLDQNHTCPTWVPPSSCHDVLSRRTQVQTQILKEDVSGCPKPRDCAENKYRVIYVQLGRKDPPV